MCADRRRSCRIARPQTVVEFRSPRARHAAGLRIDAVETLPTDLGTILVRVVGAWEGELPPAGDFPVLVLGDERGEHHRVQSLPETSGAAARAAPEDRPFRAAFSVPADMGTLLRGRLMLELGGAAIDLPAAGDAAGQQAEQLEATVVDRVVLVERRARRAELAEAAGRHRVQEAERAGARMETELAGLELRLDAAAEERAAIEVELDRRERELRASRQHAHAEQRLREDAVAAAERRVAQAGAEASELRQALTRTDRRARRVEVELAAARREADEAHQRTETAMVRARRSEQSARERERQLAQDLAVLRAELTLAASAPRVAPPPPPAALAGAHAVLLEAERRAARVVSDPVAMTCLRERADRHTRALTEAENVVAEAHTAAAQAQARLAHERRGRARGEVELGERILWLAREANGLRAKADAQQRACETAEAELQALARARAPSEAEVDLATRNDTAADPREAQVRSALKPAPGPERQWLAIGVERLVAENATAGARLALELLPGQALSSRPVSYDLLVGTLGWHEVTLAPAQGRVTRRRRPREGGESAFRLTVTPATLVALVTEGGSRRLRRRGVRVSGTLRRRRAMRALAPVPLDTGALADAGIWIDPLLLHRAVAMSIEPDWTRGHELCLEHTIEGYGGGRCFLTVSDGERVSVRNRPPAGGATTAVRTSHRAFQRALGGAVEAAVDIDGEGDIEALSTLVAWARWGERAAGSRE